MNNTDNPIAAYAIPKEAHEAANALTNDAVRALLRELEGTKYWPAVVRLCLDNLLTAQTGILTLDPNKEATAIARYQGIMSGVSSLVSAVYGFKMAEEEKARAELSAKFDKLSKNR